MGIKIVYDKKAKNIRLSQEKYVEHVLKKFNMRDSKPVSAPLVSHFKLSKSLCPSTKGGREKIEGVSYSSIVGSLIYVIVSTQLDIAHIVGVVIRFFPILKERIGK